MEDHGARETRGPCLDLLQQRAEVLEGVRIDVFEGEFPTGVLNLLTAL